MFYLAEDLAEDIVVFCPEVFRFGLIQTIHQIVQGVADFAGVLVLNMVQHRMGKFTQLFLGCSAITDDGLHVVLIDLAG
ncbi:hypothetical protein SDC9_151439 [bioreactor metagenome]|uniref:Uncharacterized protein n=1 Tax=bioreactor metagenome TaxID=1076179 RepID=A0A645EUM2_9ZZZZ